MAVVCDGMGGLAYGAEAAQIACESFVETCKSAPPDEDTPAVLDRAIQEANRAVAEMAGRRQCLGNAGTTLAAAAFSAEGLHWIAAGDSAILLYRNGALTRLNHPHTYAAILDARALVGEISRSAALEDRQRDALTSFVGVPSLRDVDASIRPFPLASGDIVLVASDGLTKTLEFDQIEPLLAEGPRDPARSLVEAVLAKGRPHQDNVTVCVLSLAGSGKRGGCLGAAVVAAGLCALALAAARWPE